MRLSELLKFNNITIQCHDNPDADALASGYALLWYFDKMGKKAKFIYRGKNKIQKSNLKIMLDKLEIPVSYEPELDEAKGLLVTIDCQYGQKNVSRIKAEHVAVIDHHQKSADLPKLSDVRSNLGSASTLVWDLIKKEGLDVNDNPLLATALYYGLYTDTNKFSEVSHPLDRDMQDELIVNKSIIVEMSNSNISLKELKITGNAILNYEYFKKEKYLIIHAEACDPNILGVMSDFSLETAGVDACLAYYVSPLEIKFSVRSCVKEVHANELAAFLADDLGGGGGHIFKAGGAIRPEKLKQKYKDKKDNNESKIKASGKLDMLATDYLHERIKEYFNMYEVIYAKETTLSMDGMKKYEKIPQEFGYVKLTDVFPKGTLITVRTLEGDIDITIDKSHYLMVGITGEIYPIAKEKFKKSYKPLDDSFDKKFEYDPSIKNSVTGEKKSVMAYVNHAVSKGNVSIYARPLDKCVKLFTAWDDEKYYSGAVGDYIAFREDDPHDIYIIKKDLFDQLYKEIKK